MREKSLLIAYDVNWGNFVICKYLVLLIFITSHQALIINLHYVWVTNFKNEKDKLWQWESKKQRYDVVPAAVILFGM